jgi:hypothetical protein
MFGYSVPKVKGVVKFIESGFYVDFEHSTLPVWSENYWCNVVGNTHQNPELVGAVPCASPTLSEETTNGIEQVEPWFIAGLLDNEICGKYGNAEMQKKYWCKNEDGIFTACDNTTGDAWTEDFTNFDDVKKYFNGMTVEEIEKEAQDD